MLCGDGIFKSQLPSLARAPLIRYRVLTGGFILTGHGLLQYEAVNSVTIGARSAFAFDAGSDLTAELFFRIHVLLMIRGSPVVEQIKQVLLWHLPPLLVDIEQDT